MSDFSYYFGCRKLTLNIPESLLIEDDISNRFRHGLLPVDAESIISVQAMSEAEALTHLPQLSEPVYQDEKFEIYRDADRELRFYHMEDESARVTYAYSICSDNKIQLVLYKNSNYLQAHPHFPFLHHIHIEQQLLQSQAMILHSCFMEYHGKGILFTAPSGTGKTTQGKLWERIYQASIINGDRCLIQKYKDRFYGCGYFNHGSAPECENRIIPLDAIVIVRQSPSDQIVELSLQEKIQWIYSETTVNKWNSDAISATLDLIIELVTQVRVIRLNCTMNDSAAHVLHHYLYKEKLWNYSQA